MAENNEQIRELQGKIVRKKQLTARLESLQGQRKELEQRERDLDARRSKEQSDVDHLEGRSLKKLFFYISGRYDDKLSVERREAYEAAVRHETVRMELEAVEADIDRTNIELSSLADCEQKYSEALEQKKEKIKETDPAGGQSILGIEEEILYLDGQRKEIEEAAAAGRLALTITEDMISNLNSAENWGTWDMLGGGLLSDLAKHSHLDEAQRNVERLQVALRNLKTELADVRFTADIHIQIDGFLRFADYFFDGIIADWVVLNRIYKSQEQVAETKKQIQSVLAKLNILNKENEGRIEELKRQREALIVRL